MKEFTSSQECRHSGAAPPRRRSAAWRRSAAFNTSAPLTELWVRRPRLLLVDFRGFSHSRSSNSSNDFEPDFEEYTVLWPWKKLHIIDKINSNVAKNNLCLSGASWGGVSSLWLPVVAPHLKEKMLGIWLGDVEVPHKPNLRSKIQILTGDIERFRRGGFLGRRPNLSSTFGIWERE